MPKAKFKKLFPYRTKGGLIEYPAGYEGDIPQAHYDRAVEAGGYLEDAPAKTSSSDTAQADKSAK